jgi:hypothetical protein
MYMYTHTHICHSFLSFLLFVVLRIEPRALHKLDKYSAVQLSQASPFFAVSLSTHLCMNTEAASIP